MEPKKFVILGEITTMNEYTYSNRGGWGFAVKQDETQRCADELAIQADGEIPTPAIFSFTWYRKDRRTDPDNIAFSKKFLMDAFQEAGLIENDGWLQVGGFEDRFIKDKDNPRVEIVVRATDKGH